MRNTKPIYLSLPILLTGLLLLRNAVREDQCYGIADGLINVLLWLFGLVVFGITLVTSTQRYHRQRDTLELLPLFVPGGIFVLYVVIESLQMLQADEPVLHAKMAYGSTLTLKENKTYRLQDVHDDWGCLYSGDYTIRGDTLQLAGQVEKATHGTFADYYVVRETYLVPLVHGKVNPDSLKYLFIKNQKVESRQAIPH